MDHVNELIPEYALGQLDDGTRASVSRHLSHCHACQQEHDRTKLLFEYLKGTRDQKIAGHYFENIVPRVRQRLAKKKSMADILASPLASRVLATLAVVILVIVTINISVTPRDYELRSLVQSFQSSEMFDVVLQHGQKEPWTQISAHQYAGSLIHLEDINQKLTEQLGADALSQPVFDTGVGMLMDLTERDVEILIRRLGERKIL
jgi:hypothetical protein